MLTFSFPRRNWKLLQKKCLSRGGLGKPVGQDGQPPVTNPTAAAATDRNVCATLCRPRWPTPIFRNLSPAMLRKIKTQKQRCETICALTDVYGCIRLRGRVTLFVMAFVSLCLCVKPPNPLRALWFLCCKKQFIHKRGTDIPVGAKLLEHRQSRRPSECVNLRGCVTVFFYGFTIEKLNSFLWALCL